MYVRLPRAVGLIERSHIGFDEAVATVCKKGGFFEDVIIDDPIQIRIALIGNREDVFPTVLPGLLHAVTSKHQLFDFFPGLLSPPHKLVVILHFKVELDLFGEVARAERVRTVYEAIDRLDAKYGKHTVFLGSSYAAINGVQHQGGEMNLSFILQP
jgi:hypothetical protein